VECGPINALVADPPPDRDRVAAVQNEDQAQGCGSQRRAPLPARRAEEIVQLVTKLEEISSISTLTENLIL
jgi:hypothetical protein